MLTWSGRATLQDYLIFNKDKAHDACALRIIEGTPSLFPSLSGNSYGGWQTVPWFPAATWSIHLNLHNSTILLILISTIPLKKYAEIWPPNNYLTVESVFKSRFKRFIKKKKWIKKHSIRIIRENYTTHWLGDTKILSSHGNRQSNQSFISVPIIIQWQQTHRVACWIVQISSDTCCSLNGCAYKL